MSLTVLGADLYKSIQSIDSWILPIMQIVTKDRTKTKLLTFELRIWLNECAHVDNLNLSAQGRSFNSSLAFHFQANIDIKMPS